MPQVAGPRPHRPGVLLLPPAEVPEFPTQDIALVDLDTVAHASASCLPELAAAAGIATFPPLSRLKTLQTPATCRRFLWVLRC